MKKFQVVFEHDVGGWHVFIPTVKGCRTWGRTLEAARRNIREALASCSDVFDDADGVAKAAIFDEDIRLPKPTSKALRAQEGVRRRALDAAAALQENTAHVAKLLTNSVGLSLRDAGELLGLSQEGVRQLLRVGAKRGKGVVGAERRGVGKPRGVGVGQKRGVRKPARRPQAGILVVS